MQEEFFSSSESLDRELMARNAIVEYVERTKTQDDWEYVEEGEYVKLEQRIDNFIYDEPSWGVIAQRENGDRLAWHSREFGRYSVIFVLAGQTHLSPKKFLDEQPVRAKKAILITIAAAAALGLSLILGLGPSGDESHAGKKSEAMPTKKSTEKLPKNIDRLDGR